MINIKYFVISVSFILFILFSFSFLEASTVDSVDLRVRDSLESQTHIPVIVTLKSDFGLGLNYPNDSKKYDKYIEDVREQVDEIQSNVIPYLSSDEFEIKYIFELSPSFSGNITQKGLEKLSNDPNVESIELVEEVYASLDKSGSLIGADYAYDDGHTGEGVTVCVVDSAIIVSNGTGWVVVGGIQ